MSKIIPKFNATYKRGHTVLDFKDAYDRYCRANFKEGDKLVITVKKYRKIRSTGAPGETGNQNGWYWDVVLPIISEWSGHTVDELHEIYKSLYAPKKRYLMKDGREVTIAKSTGDMDTLEFTEYVERIRADVGEQGVVIPDPVKVDVE